jgi:OOP family OmpA-OmpF porin
MKTNRVTRLAATLSIAVLAGSVVAQTAPADAPADGPAPAPVVQKVSVKGVARFDFDRAIVHPEDGLKLMGEVRAMKNVTWQTISVVGHTDSLGSRAYNQHLSQRRADAVQAFLIEKGVKPERIRTSAMGKASPVASNASAGGRAANRRAEIEFQGLQTQ